MWSWLFAGDPSGQDVDGCLAILIPQQERKPCQYCRFSHLFLSSSQRHELRFIVCFGDKSGVRFSKGQTSLALCVVSLNSVVKDGPWVPVWVSVCDQWVTVTCVGRA